MRVEAMTQRITLEISLTDISPDNDEYEQRCAYYDTFLQEWVIDEGERTNDDSMFCYPNHLTTFAVLRVPTEYSKIPLVKSFILTSVVIFDAFITYHSSHRLSLLKDKTSTNYPSKTLLASRQCMQK